MSKLAFLCNILTFLSNCKKHWRETRKSFELDKIIIFQHAWASRYLLESLRKLSKKQIHDTRNNKKHHMIFLFLLFFQQLLSSKFLQDIGTICFATLFGQNKKQQYFLLKRFAILLTFKFRKITICGIITVVWACVQISTWWKANKERTKRRKNMYRKVSNQVALL